jgi:hypothetical protein
MIQRRISGEEFYTRSIFGEELYTSGVKRVIAYSMAFSLVNLIYHEFMNF